MEQIIGDQTMPYSSYRETIAEAYQTLLSDKDKNKFDLSMADIKANMETELEPGEADRAWRMASREAYSRVRNQKMAEVMRGLEPPDLFLAPSELAQKRDAVKTQGEPRVPTPRPDTKDILNAAIKHREALTLAVPNAGAHIRHAETELKQPRGCSGCARNRLVRGIGTVLSRAARLKVVDVDDIVARTDEALRPLFNPVVAQGLLKDESGAVHREACQNCVVKHLSQALSLVDEVLQGYPGHVDIALQHLAHAIDKAPMEDANKMRGAMEELKGAKDAVESPDRCRHYLLAASKVMGAATGLSRDRWRLIGHLGEAADECVLKSPKLSEMIRSERLRVMDDPGYKRALERLLNLAGDI